MISRPWFPGNYVTNIERWRAVGHRFSLVLSREITDDETAILKETACAGPVFTTDSHPVNTNITVTKLDFDDTISPSLTEAIESALAATKGLPDLSVPSLSVPAQPTQNPVEETAR
jgi:hypothetical protein